LILFAAMFALVLFFAAAPPAWASAAAIDPLGTSPTPSPTAKPTVQGSIREGVASADATDIEPTPPKASKDLALDPAEAAERAIAAAKASFRGLDISKLNAQKQIDTLRSSVNMAITALEADNRYKTLKAEEELWGEKLEPELRFELKAYQNRGYKELTSDERRQLINARDLGYEQFNSNLKRIDYTTETTKHTLTYGAYAQFAGIAKLQSAVSLQQEALELQRQSLEILNKKFELGAAARVEVSSAEIAYEKAQIDLRKTQRSLTSLVTGFNKLLGENLETTYQEFDRKKIMPKAKDDPVEKYLERALTERSEILLAASAKSLAERQAALYETEITKLTTLDDKREAIQTAEEAAIDYDAAVLAVESGIRDAYKQLRALRSTVANSERQVQTAQDNYDRAQKIYELGMSTTATVDQARVALTQAKMTLENSKIDVWLQQQKLEIISGIGPGSL
jgi:hypothetical protein